LRALIFLLFLLNATPPTDIYPLSLHDALPICGDSCLSKEHLPFVFPETIAVRNFYRDVSVQFGVVGLPYFAERASAKKGDQFKRSEEHTSELQSRGHLVCRLLLEKKKKQNNKK